MCGMRCVCVCVCCICSWFSAKKHTSIKKRRGKGKANVKRRVVWRLSVRYAKHEVQMLQIGFPITQHFNANNTEPRRRLTPTLRNLKVKHTHRGSLACVCLCVLDGAAAAAKAQFTYIFLRFFTKDKISITFLHFCLTYVYSRLSVRACVLKV